MQTKQFEDRWYTVDGLPLFARVAEAAGADAAAIVLIHGLGVSGAYLLPTAEQLAGAYRVYVPDLPGYGKSAKPPRTLDIPGLADALAAWVEQAVPGPAVFVANSLGCQTVVDLAVRYPHLVEKAVLIGATIDPEARSMVRQVARGLYDLLGEPWSLWWLLTKDYWTAGPVRTALTLHYAVGDPLEEKLRRVEAPVLVVRGKRDPIAPQKWAERMVELLPHGQLVVLPGAPHAANYANPEEVAAAVRSFVSQERADDAGNGVTTASRNGVGEAR